MFDFIRENKDYVNEDMYARMKNSTSLDWAMAQGMYVFDVPTPADVMLTYEPYTLEGVIENITAATLVCDGISDSKIGGQAQSFYEALKCPKTYLVFTDEFCAGEHCQLGASGISYQEKLDWLDDQLHP